MKKIVRREFCETRNCASDHAIDLVPLSAAIIPSRPPAERVALSASLDHFNAVSAINVPYQSIPIGDFHHLAIT